MRLTRPVGDITQGVIWKQLLALFFPLWFGTFFQQLYNTVDTVVVGRFVGKVALASVGSTGVIVNLTVGIFTGLSAGAVVVIAQRYGARMGEDVHKSVHTAMLLSVIIGAVFMVIGFVLTPWALRAMDTTADALPGAILYQRVYFLGMIPNMIYNMGSGVLRALGDSRTPLFFLIQSVLRRQLHIGQRIAQRDTIILYRNIQVIFQQMMQRNQRSPIQFPVGRGQDGKETCRDFFKQLHIPLSFYAPFYSFLIYYQCIICIVQ